jgi:serine/threonine protein kinase/tetratricopeptide (TPR) repeat protein
MTERTIFIAALQIDEPARRRAYLDKACAADAALRQRLEGLLGTLDKAGGFLEAPAPPNHAGMEKRRPSPMAIFDSALDKSSPEDREAYLNAACAGEPALRQQVDGFLQAYDKADDSFTGSATGQVATVDGPITEGPGTVIGQYRLLEEIGHGGFGVVFMAEQKEPVRRKVALKVLKPGMDTREIIARFEAERQALALMDHPNIAKVFDGGQTATGRPYFVMDLVKGVPITTFCDEAQLGLKDRLKLFVDVCRAVHHSHQKGIIHRDIKPSNVLVTMQDGVPLVKMIDFGIAKALGHQLTDKTFFTGFAKMIGTPVYMSPEQAGISNVDVDTRSDIYSLGVLLYELLTGTTPIDRKRLRDAAYDEIRRIIRDEEPPKPSTRLSTLGQEASVASAQRKSDPQRLSRLFRGELDWIVMKALEKDRGRRFETAASLVEDVQLYLANQPVLAGPPTAGYRLRKFARRHRVSLLVALVVAGALVAILTTVAGSIGWVMGEKSARETEIRRRVKDAIVLARGLAAENQPTQARDKLQIARGLIANDRTVLPALAAELDGFVQELDTVKRFLGFCDQADAAETTSLGFSPQRGTHLVKALACYGVLDGTDWTGTLDKGPLGKQLVKQIRRTVYEELLWLANHTFTWWNDPRAPRSSSVIEVEPEARAHYLRENSQWAAQQALTYLSAAEKAQTPTHYFYQLRAQCQKTLGREAEARKDLEPASKNPPATVSDYYFLALAAAQKGDLDEAVGAVKSGLRLDPTHFWSHMLLGHCLMEQGRGDPQKAEAAVLAYQGCLSQRPGHAQAHFQCARAHMLLGRTAEAEKDFARAKLNTYARRIFITQGDAYVELRQWDNAINEYAKLVALSPAKEGLAKEGLMERARTYFFLGDMDKALADYAQAADDGKDGALSAIEVIYERQGELAKALPAFSRFVERNAKGRFAWQRRGQLYARLGQWERALADYTEAIKLLGTRKGVGGLLYNDRAVAFLKLGKSTEAAADFARALELDKNVIATWASEDFYGDRNIGLFAKACAELTKTIASRPGDVQHCDTLAWLLATHGSNARETERAIELAMKAVTREPKARDYWVRLGAAHYRADDWPAALKALQKSAALGGNRPLNVSECFYLAMTHWRLGNKQEAVKNYDRGVRWTKSVPSYVSLQMSNKGPESPEVRRLAAEARDLLGIQDEAP